MADMKIGFPINAVPSRRQLVTNNSIAPVQIKNFKVYPNTNPREHTILPQFYYTVFVSGSNAGGSAHKESVYSIPIIFTVGLYAGVSESDVLPLTNTVGPRGIRTIANDIQYYHYHELLGSDASSQAASGVPPSYGSDGSQKDSQSGLNTFYNLTKTDPFFLPPGMHLFADVSATLADSKGLSSVSSAFLKDNSDYSASVVTYYHEGQDANGTFQYRNLYNASLADGTRAALNLDSSFLTISFEYETPPLPMQVSYLRLRLGGSSYEPSAGEVHTSSTQFVTFCENTSYPTIAEIEGREIASGKGNLTVSKLRLYAAEYNKSEKAVYDLYKLGKEGFLEPLVSRIPIYASANVLPYNTMNCILSGTSSIDLVENAYNSQNFESVTLKPRSAGHTEEGESIVAVCRENSLGATVSQDLVVYFEGYYEQEGGHKYTGPSGASYKFNHNTGIWDPARRR